MHGRHPRFGRGGAFGPGDGINFWFGPGRRGPKGPPWGRGGPFGDDPFGDDGERRRRHKRGDIKYVLLELINERPRHGYELIKELENRYGGFYRPSPGTVYPTLQLLEDEGSLTSESVEGKRVYTITEAGRQVLSEHQGSRRDDGPWGGFHMGHDRPELAELRESAMGLFGSLMQLGRHGTAEQIRAAITRIDSLRREIYTIMAEGERAQE